MVLWHSCEYSDSVSDVDVRIDKQALLEAKQPRHRAKSRSRSIAISILRRQSPTLDSFGSLNNSPSSNNQYPNNQTSLHPIVARRYLQSPCRSLSPYVAIHVSMANPTYCVYFFFVSIVPSSFERCFQYSPCSPCSNFPPCLNISLFRTYI